MYKTERFTKVMRWTRYTCFILHFQPTHAPTRRMASTRLEQCRFSHHTSLVSPSAEKGLGHKRISEFGFGPFFKSFFPINRPKSHLRSYEQFYNISQPKNGSWSVFRLGLGMEGSQSSISSRRRQSESRERAGTYDEANEHESNQILSSIRQKED